MKIKYFILILPFFLIGCASAKYSWHGYDATLYHHYKNPSEKDKFMAELKKIIEVGEKKGNVPPGMYAEYGYTLYENQQYSAAVFYFTKEYDKWPESRLLMQKMINSSKTMVEKNKIKENKS